MVCGDGGLSEIRSAPDTKLSFRRSKMSAVPGKKYFFLKNTHSGEFSNKKY